MTVLHFILIAFGVVITYLAVALIMRKLTYVPAPPYIGRALDSNLRRLVQPPGKLIERSGIRPGMMVLDLGCGSGAFVTFVAREVGEGGRVYAVDIQPKMLAQLRRKLAKPENRDIKNIEVKQASAHQLPFEDEELDLVYMVTVLPEIPDRNRVLREISRVLKPGGILAVTEFFPDPDYPLRSNTVKTCRGEGFILDASLGSFWNYTVRFKKPGWGN